MRWQSVWLSTAAAILSACAAPAQQPIQTHHARLMVQTGQSESVTSLAFSPDGHYAVVAGGRAAVLWDVDSGRQLVQFKGHAERTEAVAFSPDGKFVLTGSDDKTARLWDAETGREIRKFVGHLQEVNAVAFSPDGRYALTGSADWSARLWDLNTGKQVREFVGREGPHPFANSTFEDEIKGSVEAVAFSANPDPALAGKYVLTGTHVGAQMWDTASGLLVHDMPEFGAANQTGRSVASSPDGQYVATASSEDGVVQLWDAQSGRRLWSKVVGAGPEGALAFSPDGRQLVVGQYEDKNKPTAIWLNAADGERLAQLPPGGAYPLAFAPDGKSLLTGSGLGVEGHPALLWSLNSGQVARRLEARATEVRSLAASAGGNNLLTLDEDAAAVWDTGNGSQTMRLMPGTWNGSNSAVSPDGKTVLSSLGADSKPANIAHLLDNDGSNLRTVAGHSGTIDLVGFTADGRDAYTRSADVVQVWEVGSGRLLYRFPTLHRDAPADRQPQDPSGAAGEAVLSPDGKWVLSIVYSHYTYDAAHPYVPQGDVAHLKDAATGKELHQLRGHTGEIISMAFSADSKYALTGSYDDTMRLWDVATGNLLQTYTGNTDIVMQVAFDSDPRYVLSGSLDGVTTIWNRATGAAVVKLFSFRDGGWAVVDPQGRYDASDPDASGSLYWVTDNRRSIDLGQLEKEYYTPGLLARALKGERLPDVTGMDTVALPPVLAVAQPYNPATKRLVLSLTNDGGGVGKLLVKVNDRLVSTLAPAPPVVGQAASLPIDLSQAPFVEGDNTIRIAAYDAANRIQSQDAVAHYAMSAASKGMTTVATDGGSALSAGRFYAIVVGTSTFADPSLKLTFPAKDAKNFAAALKLGADRLFGADNVSIRVLTSDAATPDGLPTKANIRAVFDSVHKMAKPEDTLVVYLSGHGTMSPSDRDLYYYLTADARTFDVEKDPALKDVSTVSSTELLSWLREPVNTMPGREVVILDTCAAGAAGAALSQLTQKREIPPDQRRAIEMLKDSTGTYILMGAAADAVSYEASRYGEGLLTYALLEGMRDGPFDDGSRLGVAEWFAHASERVPDLAVSIGGIQKPQIAAPKGRGFPVAMLTVADRGRIPMALPRPQLLRVLVENADQDDPLGLRDPLREQLRALNDPQRDSQPRGDGTQAPGTQVMYLDETDDDLPGALAPKLLYTVSGDTVSVRIRLVRDHKTVAEQTVSGPAADPQSLARKLASAIVALTAGIKP